MTRTLMTKTIYLKATRETIWMYLTQPDRLARWFHESDVALDTPGVEYQLLRENPSDQDKNKKMCWGKVLEADKPNRLAYTFTHTFLEGKETTVEWELVEMTGGTQLTMTHTGLDMGDDKAFSIQSDHDEGWDQHFIRLRMVAATF